MIVCHATRSDLSTIASVFIEAFKFRGDPSEVVTAFEVCFEVQPNGCFIACADGEVVGTGCYFMYGRLAWVGAVAVVPKYQRKGVGTKLMKKILSELETLGVKTIGLDATEAGYKLYRRLGFVDEYYTIMYDISSTLKIKVSTGSSVEVLNSIPEFAVEMDRRAFGADRVRVISAWLKKSARILVAEERGYAMLWDGRVGPVIAVDNATALELILKAAELGATRAIVPEANHKAVELMEVLGAVPVAKCVRMRLGLEHVEDISKVYGILNYAKG